MTPPSTIRHTWKGYLLAVGLVIAATVLKLVVAELVGYDTRIMLLPAAAMLTVWFGGLGAGLFAIALTTVSRIFFFTEPIWQFQLGIENLPQVAFYVLEVTVFCLLVYAVHRSREALRRSEREAVGIVESISDVFFSVDHEWRLLYVNQPAAALAGRPLDELAGGTLWELWPELVGTPIETRYRTAMRERQPMSFETEGVLTGTWYEINVYPTEFGISIYGREITDRKYAEHRLAKSEKRLRLAMDVAKMVAWEWDPETDEVEVSDQFAEVFGLASAQHARDVTAHVHPDDRAHHQQTIQEAAEEGKTYHITFRIIRPDTNEVVWLEEWGHAEHDDDGELRRMVGVAMDVTKRKKAEDKVRDNERMLQSMLDQLPVGIVMAEPSSGEMTYLNEEARRLLDQDMWPASGYDDYDKYQVYHADGEPFEVDKLPIIRALRGERSRDVEFIYVFPDGSELVLSVSAGPVFNGRNELVHAVSAFVDISERKRMEEDLRLQAHLLNLSHDAIIMWPLGGAIEFWNRGAEELYGFAPDQAIGRITHDLLQSRHPISWEQIKTILHREGEWEGETAHISKDGREIVVSTRKQLLEDPDGNPIVLETNRDITERKRYEEGLERAREEAEELARTKSSLLANMSHEVRTPLTGLLLLADMLSKRLSGDNREKVLKIKKGAEKLSHLLDAVLTLSRLEGGHVDIKKEVIDVVEDVEQAADALAPLAEKKNVSVTVAGRSPCHALVDDASLGIVLNNLIGNAIKFTDEGAVTVTVENGEDERVGGAAVTVCVRDTGKGIAPEFLPHIFEEFRQESTGVGRSHEGAGLGLTISKRLIDLMGGVIDVQSEPGTGTVFTAVLPGAVPPDTDRKELTEPPFLRSQKEPRVLAMDDDEVTLALVPELLDGTCTVEMALTPEKAIELAISKHFDVVLLDISMSSDTSGVDVLHTLRQHSYYNTAPIIAMTAYALPGDKARFLELGFDAYVSKPFSRSELVRTVTRALSEVAR